MASEVISLTLLSFYFGMDCVGLDGDLTMIQVHVLDSTQWTPPHPMWFKIIVSPPVELLCNSKHCGMWTLYYRLYIMLLSLLLVLASLKQMCCLLFKLWRFVIPNYRLIYILFLHGFLPSKLIVLHNVSKVGFLLMIIVIGWKIRLLSLCKLSFLMYQCNFHP